VLIYLQTVDTQSQQATFEKVYTAYRRLMFYIAKNILQNDEDAEDAVHNAFVAIAENIEKIEAPVCPKTKGYVVTVVESKAIDIYRKKQRQRVISLNEDIAGTEAALEEAQGIAHCFARLPIRYRHILLLKYRYGYNNRELAKLLKISEANAIKLTQRAKEKLDQFCREECIR
jgi:RNA polymerase sigma-70 factor (ECF subfamily)